LNVLIKGSIPDETTKILNAKNRQTYKILKIHQKLQSKKRAISDIIVTMLLVGITVVAGVIIYGIFSGSGVTESATKDISQPVSFQGGIKLVGYDARDGSNLMGISGLSNNSDGDCPPTCKLQVEVGSEELIVLKIINNTPNKTFLNGIIVNEVSHTWDDSAAATEPTAAGKFSIIPDTNDTPQNTNEIIEGGTVRVVVKLSSEIGSDININDAIRVGIDAVGFDLQKFIITAGNAR